MNTGLSENEVEYADYEENEMESLKVSEPQSSDEKYFTAGYLDDEMPATVYRKTARWILLIGAALIPLFFLPWTTSVLELNKQMLLAAVAGGGLVFWLLDVVMSGKLSWRFNPLDKGLLALAGAVAISTVFSVSNPKSLMGMAGSLSDSLFVVAGLTIIYLLAVNLFDDRGKTLRHVFSVSLAVAVAYGLLQIFGVHVAGVFRYFGISIFDFTASRAFNTLGSVNALGMTAAIALSLFYASKSGGKGMRYVFKTGTFVALAALVVINWWVLWVVAIAGMVALVALESLVSINRENSFKIYRLLFPLAVIVLGVFLIVTDLNFVFVKNKLPTEIAPSHGLSGRVALAALKESFAFGYGPENFSLAFDKYGAGELKGATLSGIKFFDSTSYVLNTAVHNGLVGLAGLGFVFWVLGRSLFKALKSKPDSFDSENMGVISATTAAVVALFFYPFNTALVFSFYLLLALLVLGVWNNQKMTYNVEEKAALSLVSSLGFVGGLILSLVGLYFISLNYSADIKYAKALNQTEVSAALNYVVEAINRNENDDRFYRSSSQLALTLLSQELNTQPAKNDTQQNGRIQNYLSSAVTLAQKATQVSANEANNWTNLGNIYQNLLQFVDGADALAEAAYLKASELRPGDPAFQNSIGNVYLLKAESLRRLALQGGASAPQFNQQAGSALLKAENAYKKALEISDNFGLAIYNLGTVYDRQGKLNAAIKQLEILVPFNSNQPGLAFELGLLYYRANQKDKALEQLQRAVVLYPDYANARWYLALLYEEKNQLDQAIEQLKKILGIGVNKGNQAVLKKLTELKAGKVSIPPARVLDQKPL